MSIIFFISALIVAINGVDVLDNFDYVKVNMTILKVEIGHANGKVTLWTNSTGTQFLVVTNPIVKADTIFPMLHDIHTIEPSREDICQILNNFAEEPGYIFPTLVKMLGLSEQRCPVQLGNYPITKSAIYRLPVGKKPHCRGEMGKVFFMSFRNQKVSIPLVLKVKITKLNEDDPCDDVRKYDSTNVL